MYHVDPSRVCQTHWVGMIFECTGELLDRAAIMHHDNKGYSALKPYETLKGLEHMGFRAFIIKVLIKLIQYHYPGISIRVVI